jgi:hypothetical protein
MPKRETGRLTAITAGTSPYRRQRKNTRRLGLIVLVGAAMLISACGGGGGGSAETSGAVDQTDSGNTSPSPSTPDTIYLAVRAVDYAGQHGPYSQEVSAPLAPGQDVTLIWQAPNTTVDGQGCASVSEYVVSLGSMPGSYSEYVIARSSSTALFCRATGTNTCGNVYTCELDFTVPSV